MLLFSSVVPSSTVLDWQILTFYHSLLPCGDPGKGNYKHKSEQSLLPAHLFNALIGLFHIYFR